MRYSRIYKGIDKVIDVTFVTKLQEPKTLSMKARKERHKGHAKFTNVGPCL